MKRQAPDMISSDAARAGLPTGRRSCLPRTFLRLPRHRLLAALLLAALVSAAFVTIGCDNPNGSLGIPTSPSASAASTPKTPTPPPGPAGWSAGTFTWTSIVSPSRTMCSQLTSQVGQSWPLYVHVEQNNDSITLLLNEDGPPDPNDPMAEPPEMFVGTRNGDTITASLVQPGQGMGCPSDTTVTPETGGELTATVSGNDIAGDFTDVFGSGANEVKFVFHFKAGFQVSAQSKSRRQ